MIYYIPALDKPIQQGDIFFDLPRVDLSLKKTLLYQEDGSVEEADWDDVCLGDDTVVALAPLRRVTAIVISQDCDAYRSGALTLCEIRPFRDVEKKSEQTTSPKRMTRIITQHARINQKWFYLPIDTTIGFSERMGVDFRVTIRLEVSDLLEYRHLRKCCLNEVARAHFRERIAEFYRRYPYDEWYPLDQRELASYSKDHPEAEPFPWQRDRG